MTDDSFKFALQSSVTLIASGEVGTITGRAEYTSSQDNYLIRYRAADGRQVESWWGEDALKAT